MTATKDTQGSTVELPQGPIRYHDTGEGEPIVFVHGFLVDGRLWQGTAESLADGHRCIRPDWPMGSHKAAMKADADLSAPGVARLIADFIAALDLDRVTIVGNDSGGAISQILVTSHPERIARLVRTNCDSYDNFPPSVFKLMPPLARVPGAMTAMGLPMRLGLFRRLAFAPFAKRPVAPELLEDWAAPSLTDAGVKRDTRKFTIGMNKRHTLEAAKHFAELRMPVLLAWAPDDRFFKLSDAERLAAAIPNARLETIADAKTFVPLDQPERVAELIAGFVRETASAAAPSAA